MRIIVDAYNVLKQARGPRASEAEKQAFIQLLSRYAAKKQHEIILVFDGGYSLYPSKEQYKDIVIVYAGIHQSADDYIKKIVGHEKNKEILLVSSDNELCSVAYRMQIPSLDAIAFFKLLHEKNDTAVLSGVAGGLQKFSTASVDQELEKVMEEETKNITLKKEEEVQKRERGKQQSKHEKKLMKKIKKL